MMAEVGAAFASGLGQGFQEFGNALMNVSGINQERDRRAFERKMAVKQQRVRENREKRLKRQGDVRAFGARLRALASPGVNTREGVPVGTLEGQKYFYDPDAAQTGGQGGSVTLRGYSGLPDPIENPDAYERGVRQIEGPIMDARRRGGSGGSSSGGGGGSERETPTFSQALDQVNEIYASGSRFGEPSYSLDPSSRAAKADSLATGKLTFPELAEREGPASGQDQGGGDANLQYRDGEWVREGPLGTTERVSPEERPDLYRTESRSLLGVDRLMPDRTTAIPPSDTAQAAAGRGGGTPPGGGAPPGGEDAAPDRGTDANGVAVDLMERAGSAEAALRRIRANLGNEDPTPQEQRVIDALEDYAATGD